MLRKAFDNGRLPHAGLAHDKDAALRDPMQRPYYRKDFTVAAHQRGKPTFPRQAGQIPP